MLSVMDCFVSPRAVLQQPRSTTATSLPAHRPAQLAGDNRGIPLSALSPLALAAVCGWSCRKTRQLHRSGVQRQSVMSWTDRGSKKVETAGVLTDNRSATDSDRDSKKVAKVQRLARGGEEEAQMSDIMSWSGLTPGKDYRLQTMTVEDVAKGTTTIRSLDWDRDRFDIEFALERGTTYNSYIVKGSEKTALIDTSHEKFEQLWMDDASKQIDWATLDYLIVSHTEPDHSGLIANVINKCIEAGNEKLEVCGSKVCLGFLDNFVHMAYNKKEVKNNDKIDLGGHELEFIIAPNLHWPDTMFTFDHATGVLFTCDAFGMHYCSDNLEDVESVKELLPHYALYYDCLMKPNARSVNTALKKTKDFDVKTIACGHGPILQQNTAEWIELYDSWSKKAAAASGATAVVFWVSNFGESERLSQVFAHGLTSTGVTVEMHDLNAIDAFEITECLLRNELIVVMAPPKEGPAYEAVSTIVANLKLKQHKFQVLSSCAPAEQEPVPLLRNRLSENEVPEASNPIDLLIDGDITPQILQGYEESGMGLGRSMTLKEKIDKAKGIDKDLTRALGRLSTSLFVITAQKAGVRHAMVASWVTPASQAPLGISLTIAKDRAMEPLLRVGDSFNVNFLEEGKSLNLMKHFLQKFKPGVDRLEGVDSFPGPSGAAVFRDAIAYLECKIVSRMDANDHWVAYCEVKGGDVSKADGVTATHHRKLGSNY